MHLAINYSPPAAQLAQSGKFNIDYFKTPDWEWMIDEAKDLRPVAVHFTLEAGNDNLGEVDWQRIRNLKETTGTPYINLHLDSRQKYYPKLELDTTRKADIKRVYKVFLSDVMLLVDKFGHENVIIENSPYRARPGNTLRLCVDPDLITRIVEETGCGFLLDISHAIIASRYTSMDTREYFSRLPIRKIRELHFAGIHKINGMLIDHQSIRKKDWQWLDWVLTRIHSGEWSTPWLLAFEYGGVGREFELRSELLVIQEQIPLLYERVNNLNLSMI